MLKGWILAGAVFGFIQFSSLAHSRVEIRNHQLFVDSQPEPFLFGAELQYFRLRGGHGPNIPAEKVYGLWAKALEQMQKAGMNALSFYVPWDFHEYREGKFDFTGTADEDKDGRPDYPSRNVLHFIELARQYGFKRIMARPGPYINAEWGFLGFGAIPLWFHEKYPDSHMRDSKGRRTKLYDYQNPDFLKATRRWFQALYDQVLKSILDEKGSPLLFVQLDNETNFMWQSIYNHNYSHQAISRYRKYLRQKYFWLGRLNRVHGQNYKRWSEVFPPFVPGINLLQDQDWYRFNDLVIFDYLRKIRKMWEDIGISENEVIFTLAESYNATKNGLLPNFRYRSWPKETGMMTLNLYPKTYESGELLNFPFKADLDVKSMIQANKLYNGHQEWLLGPEIQGGWWKGIDVSPASRLQTYLTTIGHGLKALFIYYFTEGQNWQHDWAYYQIKPLFEVLALEQGFKNTPSETLPDSFWAELGKRVDENLVVGFDVKKIILEGPDAGADLYFDAPLDGEAQPRPHFHILEELGKKLVKEKGFFLAGAVELSDSVGLLKDLECHAPSLDTQLDNVDLSSNWAGGLLGFLLQAGVNPKIIHTHLEDKKSLSKFDFLFRQDCGTPDSQMKKALTKYVRKGGVLVNFAADTMFNEIKAKENLRCESNEDSQLNLHWQVCSKGMGYIVQVAEPFYVKINSDAYANLTQIKEYGNWLKSLVPKSFPLGSVSIVGGGDRTLSFARVSPSQRGLYLTVKTGMKIKQTVTLRIGAKALAAGRMMGTRFQIQDILQGQMKAQTLSETGDLLVDLNLLPEESKALFISEEI